MKTLPAAQIDKLSGQLREMRDRLLADIRDALVNSDEQRYVELAGRVHDTGDESVADLLVDVELAMIDRHIREVRAIEAAQERIRESSYGFCETCGDQIDFARLTSQPTATRCVTCQERFEKTVVQENRPRL